MSELEPTRPMADPKPRPGTRPADRDALWYDCETEGQDEGRGRAIIVGAAALTLAAIGIVAWSLA